MDQVILYYIVIKYKIILFMNISDINITSMHKTESSREL